MPKSRDRDCRLADSNNLALRIGSARRESAAMAMRCPPNAPEPALKTYMLYVHDDRYSVPNLDTVTVRDDERAIEIATQRLSSSPHYRLVEMWEDDRLVCRIGRDDVDAPTS